MSFTPHAGDLNVTEHNEGKKSRQGNWEQTSVSRWKDSPDHTTDTFFPGLHLYHDTDGTVWWNPRSKLVRGLQPALIWTMFGPLPT